MLLGSGEFDVCGDGGRGHGTSEGDFGIVGRGGVSGQVRGDVDFLRFELRDLGDVVGALCCEFGADVGYGAAATGFAFVGFCCGGGFVGGGGRFCCCFGLGACGCFFG